MSTHEQRTRKAIDQRNTAREVTEQDPREPHEDGPLVEVLEMHIVYRVPVYAANVGEALDKLREDGYAFLKEPTTIKKMRERSLSDENDRQRR